MQCQMEEENGVLTILGQVKHFEWKLVPFYISCYQKGVLSYCTLLT